MRVTRKIDSLREILRVPTRLNEMAHSSIENDVDGLLCKVKALVLWRQGLEVETHGNTSVPNVHHRTTVVRIHCARVRELVNAMLRQNAAQSKTIMSLRAKIDLEDAKSPLS